MFITGTPNADTITGTSGDDIISGLGGRDQINGGAGNDILYGDNWYSSTGAGIDTMYGGEGTDIGVLLNSQSNYSFTGSSANDIQTGAGDRFIDVEYIQFADALIATDQLI